jgi:thioester reductase-like protein
MNSDQVTFLTGATGTVGRELLVRMTRKPDTRVICLVRADSPEGAERRLTDALDSMTHFPLSGDQRVRITALRGDVSRTGWASICGNGRRSPRKPHASCTARRT